MCIRDRIKEVEKVVEVPVEVIKKVEVIVEKEVPIEIIKEVPVEVIREVEKIVEVPVEVIKEIEVYRDVKQSVVRGKKQTTEQESKRTIRTTSTKRNTKIVENVERDNFIVIEGIGPKIEQLLFDNRINTCLLYTSPSPRDRTRSRMPSSA